MPPGRLLGEVFRACATERRPRGKTQDTLESLYRLAGLRMPWCSPGQAGGGGWGEGGLGFSAWAAAPATRPWKSGRRWMDGQNEKSQTFTNEIRVHMSWTNEFLTWNPSEFCGIEKLSIMKSMLWFPDVIIVEDVSDDGSIRMSPLVTVYSNGSVKADFQQRLTFACRLNLFVFPFDLQTCYISFSSLNSDVDSITFGTISDEKFLTQVSDTVMLTRGEWELKHIDIYSTNQTTENKSFVSFRVSMLRKPMLYVIDFIIPLFYFLIMDLASFFISEAKGKKLSFKVTILLSISVLLLLLKDILPSTEKDMPIISSYCMVIFTMVAVSVLETMLVMFLMDFEGFSCFYKKAENCENAKTDVQLEPMEATAVQGIFLLVYLQGLQRMVQMGLLNL
ncbi:5-hydroxytryptamine receptor 3C-like [Pelmatolapia mariae]|uniref:5-hydroxytryptamine receptor 3C-like n=1 Tax=Pelmatolapia mariae TaxID=158779 RepID=UPI003211F7AD